MNSNQATMQKLEQMGLWGMMRAFRQSMESGRTSEETPDELFSHLVDSEWDERHNRRLARLLKIARLRYRAGLEDIDFGLRRNLEKNQLMRLADCRWVEERQDVILTGPCGCGKSFLVSVLGQQACIHGYTVCCWQSGKLFEFMKLCKADGSYLRELAKLAKKRLLLIDDFGLEVLDTASRLILLEIIEDRHGRCSSLFSSQLPVSQWHQVIGDPTIADAICDRIVHTAHRIELKGESVRKLYSNRRDQKPGEQGRPTAPEPQTAKKGGKAER
jgi:DNA replication protein DnaC